MEPNETPRAIMPIRVQTDSWIGHSVNTELMVLCRVQCSLCPRVLGIQHRHWCQHSREFQLWSLFRGLQNSFVLYDVVCLEARGLAKPLLGRPWSFFLLLPVRCLLAACKLKKGVCAQLQRATFWFPMWTPNWKTSTSTSSGHHSMGPLNWVEFLWIKGTSWLVKTFTRPKSGERDWCCLCSCFKL